MDRNTLINYVVAVIVLLALCVGGLSMLFGKIVDAWDAFWGWWRQGVQKAAHYRPVKYYQEDRRRVVPYYEDERDDDIPLEPDEPRSDHFPLLNGVEPQVNGSENPVELHLNAAETTALHRMIEHNKTAVKPSKSSTIQAGFGVSRGGSEAYKRASLIYDTLFGMPPPAIKYRARTPEQEELRKQLRLN